MSHKALISALTDSLNDSMRGNLIEGGDWEVHDSDRESWEISYVRAHVGSFQLQASKIVQQGEPENTVLFWLDIRLTEAK